MASWCNLISWETLNIATVIPIQLKNKGNLEFVVIWAFSGSTIYSKAWDEYFAIYSLPQPIFYAILILEGVSFAQTKYFTTYCNLIGFDYGAKSRIKYFLQPWNKLSFIFRNFHKTCTLTVDIHLPIFTLSCFWLDITLLMATDNNEIASLCALVAKLWLVPLDKCSTASYGAIEVQRWYTSKPKGVVYNSGIERCYTTVVYNGGIERCYATVVYNGGIERWYRTVLYNGGIQRWYTTVV
jgi:hypothetical protein